MINSIENGFSNKPTDNKVIDKELTPAERQDKIDKKVEAITKQNEDADCNASADIVRKQATEEVDNFVEVWGAIEKLGGKWYRVEGESKEVMNKWKEQITEISNALDDENEQKLNDLGIHLDKIKKNLEKDGPLDDETKKLLSISLWLKREQGGRWAGNRKTIWRVLSKDSTTLSSVLDKNGAPACIDTSYLTKALAEEVGIKGEVKKAPISKSKLVPEKMSHFYFQSDSGKVVDYWWARSKNEDEDTGGLKLNQADYDKEVAKRDVFNICG